MKWEGEIVEETVVAEIVAEIVVHFEWQTFSLGQFLTQTSSKPVQCRPSAELVDLDTGGLL